MTSAEPRKLLASLALLLLGAACGEPSRFVTASLVSPRGAVVAGTDHDRLFIANGGEDTLQVAELGGRLSDLEFVRSAAVYFALRIDAGPSPETLAATPDGRFVTVLSRVSSTVRLIDAAGLRPAKPSAGQVVNFPLTQAADPSSSPPAPADMVGSPVVRCTAPGDLPACRGQFYVSLSGRGAVLALEARGSGKAAALVAGQSYAVGGAPGALALDRSGDFLYVADTVTNTVSRVDLVSGSITSTVLGDPVLDADNVATTLAVSPSGETVIAARTRTRDLLFLDTAKIGTAEPASFGVQPEYTPQPVCVRGCSEPVEACSGAHPADQAICFSEPGGDLCSASSPAGSCDGAVVGPAYAGLFLGAIPQALLALGTRSADPAAPAIVGQEQLRVACGGVERRYSEFVAIAGLEGAVRFVGLRQQPTDPVAPEIVDSGWCEAPSVEALGDGPGLESFLLPCPALPPDLRRFSCGGGTTAGVLVYNGQSGEADWTFDWEGVLPGLARLDGGGELDDTGLVFSDVELDDLRDFDIAVGDTLEILTPARAGVGCTGDTRRCALERRITSIDKNGLGLDAPLQPACFGEGGVIAYQVRAAGNYIIRRDGLFVERLDPAAASTRFGLGGDIGRALDVTFTLRPPAAGTGVDLTDPSQTLPACSRYESNGRSLLTDADLLSRTYPPFDEGADRRFGFRVRDPLRVVRAGLDFENAPSSPIGRLPAGMTTGRVGSRDVVFLTYTGSSSLLAFDPYDVADFPDAYQLLTR